MLTANEYEYNFEIETILQQFFAIIDNCMIMRYNVNNDTKQRELKEVIKPNYLLGTKQRVMLDLVNKAKNYQLPVIAVNLDGISFEKDRLAAKHNILTKVENNEVTSYSRPTPVAIKVSVTIIAKYVTDIYQVYGKLCSQFQPYVAYSWYVPTNMGDNFVELRNKIEWDGDLSLDMKPEIKASDEDKFTGKLSFTIQGWIFPNMIRCTNGIIHDIGTTVILSDDTMSRMYDDISMFRPLVYQVVKEKEWDFYNNPRQFASAHPQICSVFRTIKFSNNSKDVHFILDKERASKYLFDKTSTKLTIDGYNLKDVKVLALPKNNGIIEGKKESFNYDDFLHPEKGTIAKKSSVISGFELNILKQTENQVCVDFSNLDTLHGEFDIIVANNIDYDSVSTRKGFTLIGKA